LHRCHTALPTPAAVRDVYRKGYCQVYIELLMTERSRNLLDSDKWTAVCKNWKI